MDAPTIAIIGSGPSGCYMAQALRRHWADAEIVIFERLPSPYGLVRYGVAPDHPGTKAVIRQFERMFERDGIQFRGNVEIGQDIDLATIRASFDIVVIATGLHGDRTLGIPGDDVPHIYGAGRITRMLNDHPDEIDFDPRFGHQPVIVGNGNVAIDVLRLLIKNASDYADSEISDESLAQLATHSITTLHVVGRSPAAQAKFDTVMIRELAKLQHVEFVIGDDSQLGTAETPLEEAKVKALKDLAERPIHGKPSRTVIFHFGWTPTEVITQEGHLVGLNLSQACDSKQLPATSLISAIGFTSVKGHCINKEAVTGANADLDCGFLDDGMFCTGWFRRGPTGTIPENRNDAKGVAEHIVTHWGDRKSSKPGLRNLQEKLTCAIDHPAWQLIDKAELQSAPLGRLRRKFRDIKSMIAASASFQSGDNK